MAGPMSCVGVFWNHRLLLIQRGPEDAYPNLWNLPGGKAEAGERPSDCAIRELMEETGIDIRDSLLDEKLALVDVSCYPVEKGRTVTLFGLVLGELPKVRLETSANGYGWFDLAVISHLPMLGKAPKLAKVWYQSAQLMADLVREAGPT